MPRQDRVGRLQGRPHAAQVHERPGQDPLAPGHRQLRAAPAGIAQAIKTARELVLLPYTQRTVTERPGGRGRDRGERTLGDSMQASAGSRGSSGASVVTVVPRGGERLGRGGRRTDALGDAETEAAVAEEAPSWSRSPWRMPWHVALPMATVTALRRSDGERAVQATEVGTHEGVLRGDVAGVGRRGDIVKVAGGFARNFLLPEGRAIVATDGVEGQAEQMRRRRDLREAQDRERGRGAGRTAGRGRRSRSRPGRPAAAALRLGGSGRRGRGHPARRRASRSTAGTWCCPSRSRRRAPSRCPSSSSATSSVVVTVEVSRRRLSGPDATRVARRHTGLLIMSGDAARMLCRAPGPTASYTGLSTPQACLRPPVTHMPRDRFPQRSSLSFPSPRPSE